MQVIVTPTITYTTGENGVTRIIEAYDKTGEERTIIVMGENGIIADLNWGGIIGIIYRPVKE